MLSAHTSTPSLNKKRKITSTTTISYPVVRRSMLCLATRSIFGHLTVIFGRFLSPRGRSGAVWGSFRVVRWSFRGRSGIVRGSFWGRWGSFGAVPGSFGGRSGLVRRSFGSRSGFVRKFFENLFEKFSKKISKKFRNLFC